MVSTYDSLSTDIGLIIRLQCYAHIAVKHSRVARPCGSNRPCFLVIPAMTLRATLGNLGQDGLKFRAEASNNVFGQAGGVCGLHAQEQPTVLERFRCTNFSETGDRIITNEYRNG